MTEHPEVETVWGPNPLCERGYATPINASADGTKIAYGSGKNVVVRDTIDPAICSVVSCHRAAVTCVRFSHSDSNKELISADENGATHMFTLNGNTLTEQEDKRRLGIGGRVYDLAWYPNDKGLCCVGDAKSNNGRVYTTSGTDQGNISTAKRLTSVDIYFYDDGKKKIQEGKIVTCADDNSIRVYKYDKGFSLDEQGNEKNSFSGGNSMVRFSPDGNFVCAVGGKEVKLLDTQDRFRCVSQATGDKKKGEHSMSVYACAWAEDSKSFLTCSADKTVKLWGVDGKSLKLLSTLDLKGKANFGPSQADFQVGCCYIGDGMSDRFVSLSLSGDLHFIAAKDGTLELERTIIAPTMEISAMDANPADGTVAVTTGNGEVLCFDKTGSAKRIQGIKETKRGVGISHLGDRIFSTGWDDCVRVCDAASMKSPNRTIPLNSQPIAMSRGGTGGEFYAVASRTEVYVCAKANPNAALATLKLGNVEATAVALSTDGKLLAVGGADKKLRFFTVAGSSVTATREVAGFDSIITSGAFNADGSKLVVGLKQREVVLVDVAKYETVTRMWKKHSATVNDVQFSPDGNYILSAGMEGDLCIWETAKTSAMKPLKHFRLSHPTGVAAARWVSNNSFYSAGCFDGSLKRWVVTL